MMPKLSFSEAVEQILQEDARYDGNAYVFVRESLDYTVRALGKPATGTSRHVTGRELLSGIREYACREFGPLTLRVLHAWGIRRSEDFGEIVFRLVEKGILGKTSADSRDDFAGGYDFDEAFVRPFLPSGHPAPQPAKSAAAPHVTRKTTIEHP